MIHEPNTFCITATKPPFLQGCKTKGLWIVTLNNATEDGKQEKVNNVYNILSIKEAIHYLHAAAGFPVKETWVKAIRASNFITWPGITVKTVNRHFPESVETQKGHMKKQRQNVISTRVKEVSTSELNDAPTRTQKRSTMCT
jgi:hypothetical protein